MAWASYRGLIYLDGKVEPSIPGHDYLNLPDYSFVITHNETGQKYLFDLGTRVDWENSVPHIAELLSTGIPGLRVKQDVTEILKDGGLNLNDVKAFILSHWHFDHCMPILHTDT